MKGKHLFFPAAAICLLLLMGCGSKPSRRTDMVPGVPATLSYARQFSIVNTGDYTIVTVFNPWKGGEVYATYYLVKDAAIETPPDGDKVLVPLKSLMVNSATHLGFLELLGELPAVTGVCNSDFIYNPAIRAGVKEGRVQDLGDAFSLNIEKLLLLRPQAVMTTAYNADDANSKKMRQTGLILLYNIEWQEETLLGRAEWIKFVAAFFDKEALADSLFRGIEQRYNTLKAKAAAVTRRPAILSGQDFRGSWSMPAGQSYNAHLFSDAGGDYYYKDNAGTGSIPLTIEEALLHFNKADVWVNTKASTLEELGKAEPRYKLFKAYKEGKVYNARKRSNATGGNDYWESAVACPDLLLSDLIKILHPDILPDYESTYLEKLAP
jgi:iron complex transport system substrate-binding protein